jgi:AraC-like DNA-binding protein
MTGTISDLPERQWDADGRRCATSWPSAPTLPGLDLVLAHTPIDFVSSAEWRWSEGHAVPNRRLPTTNLALYLAGAGTARIAGERHRIGPGSLVITPRGWPQQVAHDRGQPFHARSVHAQLPVFGGEDDLFAVLGAPVHVQVDVDGADRVVGHAFAEMARLDACRPPGWTSAVHAHLVLLIHHLISTHMAACRPPADLPAGAAALRLAPALRRIDDHLADGPIALADLAAAVGLGAVATRNLFLRLTGLPPNRYVQRQRVDRACRLLRTTALPVAEIAAQVGCSDAPVLHRLFRRWTGTTPERWRSGPAG